MRRRNDYYDQLEEELKAQERRIKYLNPADLKEHQYKPDYEKLRQQSDQFYYRGYEQEGQEQFPPRPTEPQAAPDEYNPHSKSFYQNVPGSDGSYVNDAFSKGYTYENGNDSGHFESSPDFQGFQGYYDNSGFEGYENYTGPNPFYRGYYGNTGTNPTGAPPVSPPSYQYTPDYDKLRRQSGQFYYQGYGSQPAAQGAVPSAAPTAPQNTVQPQTQAPQVTEHLMPYFKFSAVTHLWTAGGLLISFIVSMIVCQYPDIFIYSFIPDEYKYFASFIPFLVFLVSGGIALWLINKFKNAPVEVILLIYAAFTGYSVAPILVLFNTENAVIMSFSYIACLVVLAGLSLAGLYMQKNLNNIGFIFIGGAVVLVAEFLICHYAKIDGNSRIFLMTMTVILIAFNAFETTAVKRAYDEYTGGEDFMRRNAVIAAVGHYASIASMMLLLVGLTAEGSLDARTAGGYGRRKASRDMSFANSIDINPNDVWK